MKATEKKLLMVRLEPAIHTALKVKAAREATSVQALVEAAVRRLLGPDWRFLDDSRRGARNRKGAAHAAR